MAWQRIDEPITIREVEHIAFVLARECLTFNEPIPEFPSRFPHILESCLLTPFQRFYSKRAYASFVSRSAILFYLMVKNHPFQNGNKSLAITTLLVYLYKNGKWLEVDNRGLYNFAIWVAKSPAELKDEVVAGIKKFIKTYLVARPPEDGVC
jgi:death-on-curing protein